MSNVFDLSVALVGISMDVFITLVYNNLKLY